MAQYGTLDQLFLCRKRKSFFLDCDEILDGHAFMQWLELSEYKNFSAMRFSGYSHFREAKFEALSHEDLSLLVKKESFKPDALWDEDERMGLLYRCEGEKKTGINGLDGSPMLHHYGGVRTKEELLKKFSAWGHHWERNWGELVQEEFSRPFNGTDFIRKYRYREVETIFDPLKESIPEAAMLTLDQHLKGLHRFPNVIIVSKKEMFKKQLEHEFGN